MEGKFKEFNSLDDLPDKDKFIYKNDINIGSTKSLSDIAFDILIVYEIPVWLTISRGTILGIFFAWDEKYRNILFQPLTGERKGSMFLGPKNNYHWQVLDKFNEKFRTLIDLNRKDKYGREISNEYSQ